MQLRNGRGADARPRRDDRPWHGRGGGVGCGRRGRPEPGGQAWQKPRPSRHHRKKRTEARRRDRAEGRGPAWKPRHPRKPPRKAAMPNRTMRSGRARSREQRDRTTMAGVAWPSASRSLATVSRLPRVAGRCAARQGNSSPGQFEPQVDSAKYRLTHPTTVRRLTFMAGRCTGETRNDAPTTGNRLSCRLVLLLASVAATAYSVTPHVGSLDASSTEISSAPQDPPGPAEPDGTRVAADSVPAAPPGSISLPSPPQARTALRLHREGRPAPAHRERVDRPPRA